MLSNATTIAINSGSNEGSSVSIEKQSVKIVENTSKLIFALREELDKAGFKDVQIIVSSGFTWEKIKEWEDLNVPVDVYGVGSSLLPVTVGFTGDLVNLNGKPQAKEGREEIPSNRLKKVNFPIY